MSAVRESWTDERLGEFSTRIDERFDRVDKRFDEVDRRFDKVDAGLAAMGARFDSLEQTMMQIGGGLIGVTVIAIITSLPPRSERRCLTAARVG